MHALAAFSEPAARIAVATLFNSLWEGAILAIAVWALLNYLPNINATTRYAAWCVALIAALIVPVVTAIPQVSVQNAAVLHQSIAPAQPVTHSAGAPVSVKAPVNKAALKAPSQTAASPSQPVVAAPSFPSRLRFALPEALALAIFAVWVAASLFLLIRLTFNLFKLEALKRDALPLPLDYREQLARWARAEKGGRDIRLCVSEHIEVPVAVGLFDSMVLIPKHLLETLSEKEIDQITLHELAHLRRADDWTNGLQRVIQAIFFFNPAVLFMAQQLDLEREVACDDWVLHQTGDVRPYATCLTRMAEVTAWPHRALAAPGVFLTRRGLSVRVERLLRAGRNVRTSVSFGPAGAVAAALIVTFFVAQNVAPSFAFTLSAGALAAHASQSKHALATHSGVQHLAGPVKSAGAAAVKTTVVYRDKYLPAPQAFPQAIAAAATAAPRTTKVTNQRTKAVTKSYRRTRNGMVDVDVPAVDVNVPEVNVHVPATYVHVPEVNVHVPAVHVNIPAYNYNYNYNYSKLKKVTNLNGTCTGCDFSKVNWAGRNLSRVSLIGSDFSNADLHGANFSYANLSGVDFSGANLRNVNFAYANLNGCDMKRADLTGANFGGAQINGCDIPVTGLAPAQARAILTSCNGCDFKNVNLRNQDLRGVSVSGDDFAYADLRGADMRNASFNGVDFKNAKFDGARLEGASFNGCDFTGVDLRNVDLSHTQITGSRINIMR